MNIAQEDINNRIAEHCMKWTLIGENLWEDGHGGIRFTGMGNVPGAARPFRPCTKLDHASSAVSQVLRRNKSWSFFLSAQHQQLGMITYCAWIKGTNYAQRNESPALAISFMLLKVVGKYHG